MARTNAAASSLLRRLAVVLALLLLSSLCAAEPIKTTPTHWSFHLPLPDGVTGAESLAFDQRGQGPYAGVSDGRVLKWGGSAVGWTTFAHSANYRKIPLCTASVVPSEETESICGRPLGLQFYAKTGDLYIADAYLGLMKVGPSGGEAEVLATQAGGAPFHFVNGLDVDQATGDVYFTDSSATYPRRFNTEIMMNADATGRLLRYDAQAKEVTVLRSDLPYPNGVAVSADRTHVVVAHTVPSQAFRYWLKGPKAGEYELMADLPGYPDNVRRDARGGYWVALNQEKARLDATAPPVKHLVGVRLDADGVEVEELTAAKGVTLSDVAEKNNQLWLGSVELDYVGLVTYPPAVPTRFPPSITPPILPSPPRPSPPLPLSPPETLAGSRASWIDLPLASSPPPLPSFPLSSPTPPSLGAPRLQRQQPRARATALTARAPAATGPPLPPSLAAPPSVSAPSAPPSAPPAAGTAAPPGLAPPAAGAGPSAPPGLAPPAVGEGPSAPPGLAPRARGPLLCPRQPLPLLRRPRACWFRPPWGRSSPPPWQGGRRRLLPSLLSILRPAPLSLMRSRGDPDAGSSHEGPLQAASRLPHRAPKYKVPGPFPLAGRKRDRTRMILAIALPLDAAILALAMASFGFWSRAIAAA